jgi:general stress protein 26
MRKEFEMPGKQDVLEMMAGAETVYLGTIDGDSPRIRAVVNLRRSDQFPGPSGFCAKAGFTCYFSTSGASGKIRDVLANPWVSAYYSDPGKTRGIELRGRAELVDDAEIKRVLWQEEWRIYWAAGRDDPDYVILRVVPVYAAGWWGTEPFQLKMEQG